MISVREALSLVKKNSRVLSPVKVLLEQAFNLSLAEEVKAQFDIPAFRQSSMDGYAFLFSDWEKNGKLLVRGEIPAGSAGPLTISANQAVRIFTGAALPDGADTVVMQEKVSVENDELSINDKALKAGSNVRAVASEIKKGELALEKNSRLTPAAVGFLAGIGQKGVSVYPKPSVSIIVTGDELQSPGSSLQRGQVFESNSYALKAALHSIHIDNIRSRHAKDDPEEMIEILKQELQISDLILIAGGISVGDYDFVLRSLTTCGISKIFHRVKQKPGKPLYFGKNEKSLVFGLPGNPSSVLTSFYEYVIPAIEVMSATENIVGITRRRLKTDYKKNPDLTFFLKGLMEDEYVTPLSAQESFRMRSYAKANCLIKMDEGVDAYNKGDEVEVHILPL